MTALHDDAAMRSPWVQSVKIGFGFLFVAVAVLALAWLVSNVRSVAPDMRGAVLRFGSLDRVAGPGLLLAWPRPIEDVILLPAADRSLTLRISRLDAPMPGRELTTQNFPISTDPRANIAFFLTGDAGVAHLSADAVYRVTDPAAYLLARDRLEDLLQRVVIASAVTVTATRDLNGILVTEPQAGLSSAREQLRADLVHEVNRRLDDLAAQPGGTGIAVTRIDLGADLPSIAKKAFDQVLVATQEADEAVAQARTDAESWRQSAYQARDKVLGGAVATGQETIARAHARTAEIAALAGQPDATSMLDRIYFERIAKIVAKANRVDLLDAAGGGRLILPGNDP